MNKEIVSRIEDVIEHLDLTVSAFADEIGVQRSSISHLLNGRNKPSLDFVMKLVGTYPEVDLDWLLKGEGEFPKKSTAQPKPKAPELFKETSEPHLDESVSNIASQKRKHTNQPKEPFKIVMFYSDGTFQTFETKKD